MRNAGLTGALAARVLGSLVWVCWWCVAAHAADAPWVDARDYADLAAAIASVGERDATVLVATPLEITKDLSVGGNVQLTFLRPGCLDIASGVTVTIGGPLDAPLIPVFAGAGNATFAKGNASIAQIYPQWWGACGDGTHDDTNAIQYAVNAARDMGGGEVVVTSGTFKTTGTIYLWGVEKWDNDPKDRRIGSRGIHLSGLSRRASVIHFTGSGPALWLYTAELAGVRYYHAGATVRCLHLVGSNAPETTGLRVSAPRVAGSTGGSACVENCAIEQFDVGLHVEHSYGALFSYNKIRYNQTGVQIGSPEEGGIYNINGNSFRDNEISLNEHVGLRIYNGDHNLFEGGLIEGNGDEGIYIERTQAASSGYLTFRNIWIEANQKGKPASDLGQAYVHATMGPGYKAQRPVTFERCNFNCQGANYHLKVGSTIGLQLMYNQFSHPNDRIVCRVPDTYCAWAVIRSINEDQNKVIRGVFAGRTAKVDDATADDVVGTALMPQVYYPANAAKSSLTAGIEADARTHSAIASASSVFTTEHTIGEDRQGFTGNETTVIALPQGAALVGLSVYCTDKRKTDATLTLVIDGKPTSLTLAVPSGTQSAYRTFGLDDYQSAGDWVSGAARPVCFRIDGKVSSKTQFNVVAFWRSNHLPVF